MDFINLYDVDTVFFINCTDFTEKFGLFDGLSIKCSIESQNVTIGRYLAKCDNFVYEFLLGFEKLCRIIGIKCFCSGGEQKLGICMEVFL